MGTPKRFQLATLWDNDAGFHTNEGSKIPPARYLNTPYHHPTAQHHPPPPSYSSMHRHALHVYKNTLSSLRVHCTCVAQRAREPISHRRDSGCCQSVCGAVNPKIIPRKANTLQLARAHTHIPSVFGSVDTVTSASR